jgi:hypothetical protein
VRIKQLAIRILLIFSLIAIDPGLGWALEPITDALLDKADRDAKDVVARAEAAGNAVAKAIGEQVLKAIQALREAVHSSIGDAKEAYLQSQRETYDNISKLLDQAENIERVSMTDITSLLATVSNEVGNLPFINMPPAVMLYQPHVMVPDGPSEIPVHVIGPKLASSSPSVTFNNAPVQLQKSRDVEVIALLDRKTMTFEEREPRYVPVQIKYDQAQTTVWKPWTWFAHDIIQRDMTLLLLPKIMGSYSIQTKLNSTEYKYKDIQRPAGGHGMDNTMDKGIGLDPPDVKDGWKINVDKLVKEGLKYWTTAADAGASCSGLVSSTLTPDGFSFRLTHGHKTDSFGHKSDVDVQCAMTVPLVKATPIIIDGPTQTGDIGWSKDVRQPFPADLASYVVALKLFNSKEYLLDADTKVPYGLIEITRGKDFVQFRPKPPADF